MNKTELKKAVAEVTKLEGENLDNAVSELIVAKADAEAKATALEEASGKEAEAAEKTISELEARAEAAEAKVSDLEEQLAVAKEDPSALNRCDKTFKVGKTEYRFKAGVLEVVVPGRILKNKKKAGTYKAEEVAGDKEIREALVEIEFGGIEEVPSK